MNFNSPIFLFLFLPLFFVAYFLVPGRGKLFIGILGSLVFYAWGNLVYLPFLIGLVLFSYLIALAIEHWNGHRISAALFWGGILTNVFLLIGFKALNKLDYPLGLSYLTFQIMAYFIEVYTGKLKSERNVIDFSFYLLLFPKIPVGPIVRYSSFKGQIKNFKVDAVDIAEGLRRFIIGLAKKVLIADTLARVINPIFNFPSPVISAPVAWCILFSYALQLYFDFSGFADMSIGLGKVMGFRFVENFNHPYLSKSIGDFWRRWHISLSSWFRDFVFYPLERHRFSIFGQPINILIVFLLTGLWHGISINFVIWGLIHGFALIFESTFLGKKIRSLWDPLQHIYALSVILIGWVFFLSPTPHFARVFLYRLLGDTSGLKTLPFELTSPWPFVEPTFVLAFIAGMILIFPIGQWFGVVYKKMIKDNLLLPVITRVLGDLVLIFILIVSIAAMASSSFSPGIYEAF